MATTVQNPCTTRYTSAALAAKMAQTASSARKACRRSAIRPATGPHTSRNAVAPPSTSPSSSGPSPRPARKAGKKGEAHPNALKSAQYSNINRSRTGRSTAMDLRFSRALPGAAVVVNYSASKEDADRVVADIKAKGGKAIAVKGDVAKADDIWRKVEETTKTFG